MAKGHTAFGKLVDALDKVPGRRLQLDNDSVLELKTENVQAPPVISKKYIEMNDRMLRERQAE